MLYNDKNSGIMKDARHRYAKVLEAIRDKTIRQKRIRASSRVERYDGLNHTLLYMGIFAKL